MKQLNQTEKGMSKEFAKILIDGAEKCISRSHWIYLTNIILFFSAITLCWNLYLSWVTNFYSSIKTMDISKLTIPQSELLRLWTKSTYIELPIINVPIQISDAAVIISLAFFILVIWLFFSVRRENHVVGKSLMLAVSENASNELKKQIYYGITFSNLFSSISDRDDPITSLTYKEPETKARRSVRPLIKFVFFAPALCIFLIITFDILSLFAIESSFRSPYLDSLINELKFGDIFKIVIMEFVALVFGVSCIFLGYQSWIFEKETNNLLKEFAKDCIDWKN